MKLTNEQKIIWYLLKNVDSHRINRTLIFKLIFLVDFEFYTLYNKQITSYNYCFYNYGPFCPDIYLDLDALEFEGMIVSQKFRVIDYIETKYECKKEIDFNFDREVKRILDLVIELGNKLSLKEILEIIYDLPLLKNTPRYENLDLTKMKTTVEKKEKVNIDKYKKIINKLNLEEKEEISPETAKAIEQEYKLSCGSIDKINREFIDG